MIQLSAEQHRKAMSVGELIELLKILDSPDSPACIVTSSNTAFSIKKAEVVTARSTLTKQDTMLVRLSI